jgi:hypothetical protein
MVERIVISAMKRLKEAADDKAKEPLKQLIGFAGGNFRSSRIENMENIARTFNHQMHLLSCM